ncbi:hypothetical protein FNF28_07378 [Cafeteria roenbergensis]|uniref:Uncharacterized protein n=1 Tax=Cafeteria roenbergensis TaxID=33653 RepID=A0A5A8CAX8_CAFRO|nr:hypothetical protein FNF28_07378 [Cafeteria roenbergensis]
MADLGLTVLNKHLRVALYNGGAIDEDCEGIAPVFDKFDDVEAYHETTAGKGFDVVLEPTSDEPMAVTHAVILGPVTCSCPLKDLGIFVRSERSADDALDGYTAASKPYTEGGAASAGPTFAFEAVAQSPYFNGVGRASAVTPFGHLHLCLRSCELLDDEAPYVNIDLGSIVLLGYRGAAAIEAARAAGDAAIPHRIPAALGLPPVGAEAGVVNTLPPDQFKIVQSWPTLVMLTNRPGNAHPAVAEAKLAMEAAAPLISKRQPVMSNSFQYQRKDYRSDDLRAVARGFDEDVAAAGPLVVISDVEHDIAAQNAANAADGPEDEEATARAAAAGAVVDSVAAGAAGPAAGPAEGLPAEEGFASSAVAAAPADSVGSDLAHLAAAATSASGTSTGAVASIERMGAGEDGSSPLVFADSNPGMEAMIRAALASAASQSAGRPVPTASTVLGAILLRCRLDGGVGGPAGEASRAKQNGPVGEIYYLDPRASLGQGSAAMAAINVGRFRLRDWREAGSPPAGTRLPLDKILVVPHCGHHALPAPLEPAPTADELVAFVAAAQAGSAPEMLTDLPLSETDALALRAGKPVPPATPETSELLAREAEARAAAEGIEFVGAREAVYRALTGPNKTGRALMVIVSSALRLTVPLFRGAALAAAVMRESGVPVDVVALGYRSADAWARVFPDADDDDIRLFLPTNQRPVPAEEGTPVGWAAVPGVKGPGLRPHWDLLVPSVSYDDWLSCGGMEAASAMSALVEDDMASAGCSTPSSAGAASGAGGGAASGVGGRVGGAGDADVMEALEGDEELRRKTPTAAALTRFVTSVITASGLVPHRSPSADADTDVEDSGSVLPSRRCSVQNMSETGAGETLPSLQADIRALTQATHHVEVLARAADELVAKAENVIELAESAMEGESEPVCRLRAAAHTARVAASVEAVTAPDGPEELGPALEALEEQLDRVGAMFSEDASDCMVRVLDGTLMFSSLVQALADPDVDSTGMVLVHKDGDKDSLVAFNTVAEDLDGMSLFASLKRSLIEDLEQVGADESTPLPFVVALHGGDTTIIPGIDAAKIHEVAVSVLG